ncbi:MAG: type II toxin-antitoxin system MqsA family antitoxin [Anaerolineaceae bacterium]|nr:type II toxin-antitoxin system MqsA family antitoxin [Anaerolineaceae bacterium]
MTILTVCPQCDEGALHPTTYTDSFKYGAGEVEVSGLQCFECDSCGAETLSPEQIVANQNLIADAKRQKAGLLSADEIRLIRNRLGLSQKTASQLFGGGENAFSKYERGVVIQSEPMDMLLRLVSEVPAAFEYLKAYKLKIPPAGRDDIAPNARLTTTIVASVVPEC